MLILNKKKALIIFVLLLVLTVSLGTMLEGNSGNGPENVTASSPTETPTDTKTEAKTQTPSSTPEDKERNRPPTSSQDDGNTVVYRSIPDGDNGEPSSSGGKSVPTPNSNVSVEDNPVVCCTDETTTHSGS